ncbi:MAG: LD-carboxypeptidase [Firmicutes bacterium]|nr:LD-carboxypeptidase [Bacillota bacterium]
MEGKPFPARGSGDYRRVRIVAPARAVNPDAVERTVAALTARGMTVTLGDHVFDVWHDVLHLAGRDEDRAHDLVMAIEDPAVDWILTARGGYGSLRLLPYLPSWTSPPRAPKPLVGFSDVTVLHALWRRWGWWSIHGANAEADWSGEAGDSAIALLTPPARLLAASAPLTCLAHPVTSTLLAPWWGGNLTLVAALAGTPYQPSLEGSVLYLEEVDEAAYRIDRLLQQLYLAGFFAGVRGVVFGGVSGEGGAEEGAVRTLLGELGEKTGCPVWWGFPSSHRAPTLSVPWGVPLAIDPDGWVSLRAGDAP